MMRLAFFLVLAPVGAAAQPCRVLVNLEDAAGLHRVADVTLTDPPTVTVVPGLALGSGATITQLRVVADGGWVKGFDLRFDTLMARTGATEKTWLGGRQELEKPSPDQVAPWNADFDLQVVGIFGSRISVAGSGYGFLGGAHDFDDRSPRTLLAPGGEPVDVAAWLGAPYLDAARNSIEAERKTRDDGWEGGPQATPEALKNAVVKLQGTGIVVETSMDCCTWAENHNYHDLSLPLPAPADLKGLVPDAQGWFDTGTCAVRHDERGQLHSRQGPVVSLPGRLLGIAWIDTAAPRLVGPKVDEAARKAAFTRARSVTGQAEDATVLAILHKALDADPENAETLGEIGYLHLKAKQYAAAEVLTQRALEGVVDADLDGRLRYNLARIAEAQGDRDRARRLLKSSLARRPNPIVKKALADLDAAGK